MFLRPSWSLALFVSFISSAYAGPSILNLNQLLDHVETMSPEIQKAKMNLEIVRGLKTQAAQIPNPEIAAGNWSGKAKAQSWKQTDITVVQPIELGGKRQSRIEVAEAQEKEAQVTLVTLSAEIRLKVLFSMYRMRQLNDEIETMSEAKHTFENLVKNYRKRPQLSPEQSTSLYVFDLTENEYDLLLEDARTEMNLLESDFKVLTGLSVDEIRSFLPQRLKKWPSLSGDSELNSPTLRILSARTQLSEKELELAKADIWPTVSIGPSYTMQNQFGEQANILGVVVSLPLPIWNQNNGAREIAARSIVANRKFAEIEKNLQGTRRTGLLKSYLSSSRLLESQAIQSIHFKGHQAVEQNFLRGLVSSPLVIESHRQYVDAQKLYHSRELKALDYYYQLILLQGGKIEGFTL